MTDKTEQWKQDIMSIVDEWKQSGHLKKGNLFVIGCSTSEVAGETIGTAGSEEIAAVLFDAIKQLKTEHGVHLAFQGCEHINRSLVVERETCEAFGLEEVTVVPVREAGGSMAAYAYKQMDDAVVVETVKHQAHAGMDIGETMIGMHLRPVAVPFRLNQRTIGNARIATAYTRPKLIGGKRAKYEIKSESDRSETYRLD